MLKNSPGLMLSMDNVIRSNELSLAFGPFEVDTAAGGEAILGVGCGVTESPISSNIASFFSGSAAFSTFGLFCDSLCAVNASWPSKSNGDGSRSLGCSGFIRFTTLADHDAFPDGDIGCEGLGNITGCLRGGAIMGVIPVL